MRLHRRWERRDEACARDGRDERGAIAPIVAVFVIAILGAAALVVDIGTQRVARTDVQALADVVALDLSRELDGRTWNQLSPLVDGMATESRQRNGDGAGDVPSIVVALGEMRDGAFAEYQTNQEKQRPATAVKVTASTAVDFAIGGLANGGRGETAASAIGISSTAACYKLGSWAAASAGTGDWALLTPWLRLLAEKSGGFGDGSAVKSLNYHPLAAASVDLAGLASALGTTVTALATSQVPLKQLMTALKATATPLSSPNTSTMTTLVNTASTTKTVTMSKVFAVDATFGLPTGATLNLLDVVGSAISQVDPNAISELSFGSGLISGMSFGFVQSSMTDGPRQYCGFNGATRLSSSAMGPKGQYSAGGLIGNSTTNALTITGFPLTATSIFTAAASSYTRSITGYGYVIADALNIGASTSRLASLSCANNSATIEVTRGAATVGVKAKVFGTVRGTVRIGGKTYTNATVSMSSANNASGFDYVAGDAGQIPVTLSPATTVTRTVTAGAGPVPAGPATVSTGTVTFPHGIPPVTVTYTSNGRQVSVSATDAEKKLIYESVYQSAMAQMVDPARSGNFVTRYVEPLIALAGVSVGGVEVSADGTPPLTCSQPRLAG